MLPSIVEAKLGQVRRRQAIVALARSFAIAASVLIGLIITTMLVDWWLTLFDTRIRLMLTVSSLAISLFALLVTGMRPFVSAFGWTRAAINVDREVPQLEERWTTVASFAMPLRDPRLSPIGKAMLRQVSSEAVAMERLVQPTQVVSLDALRPAIRLLGSSAAFLAVFMATTWPQSSVLFQRFWMPTANITATQLRSVTGDIVVPRGERVELVTKLDGLARNSALLEVENLAGVRDSFQLKAESEKENEFVHSMILNESARYHVRAGDGQTQWHSMTVIDFPALGEIKFTVTPPEYVNRPSLEKDLIPSRVKVVQGSLLEIWMKPLKELATLEIELVFDIESTDDNASPQTTKELVPLVADPNGWYRFETQLMENLSLSPTLQSIEGLTNEEKQTCRIQVIPDQAPVARVISQTDDASVTADDVIEIKFEAHDDHGIASAELVVYQENPNDKNSPPKILSVQPIELGDQGLQPHLLGSKKLDLSELKLEAGATISYSIRVSDNRSVKLATNTTKQESLPSNETNSPNIPNSNAVATQKEGKETEKQLPLGALESKDNPTKKENNESSKVDATDSLASDSSKKSSSPTSPSAEENRSERDAQNHRESQPEPPVPENKAVALPSETKESMPGTEQLNTQQTTSKPKANDIASPSSDNRSKSNQATKGESLETSVAKTNVSIVRENRHGRV